MGRPLYSRTFRTTPAVRDTEPPSCERWSYLNAFDPDSDEFFDNENAVYEDFVDPVTPVHPGEDMDDEERDVLVVRMGNASPISSDSSLSDDESPLAVGAPGIGQRAEADPEPAVRVRLTPRPPPTGTPWRLFTESGRPREMLPRRRITPRSSVRGGTHRSPSLREESLPMPTPSAPIPVPSTPRRSATFDERALPSPSTPPRQTPLTHVTMSPPPASTPRLYTWSRNPTHSTSPSSGSPFTNPHARTSYTHLSPALVRIRDVTV